MRFIWLVLWAPAFLLGQRGGPSAPLAAPIPRIGIIDFYGLRKIPEDRVRKALGVREGDPLPPSKEDVEERIEQIPGVVRAKLEAVCCVDGEASLFVGVEERGGARFALRSAPSGPAVLPDEMLESYQGFLAALREAASHGNEAEDLTRGHSLMASPEARAYQERFLKFAAEKLPLLRDVLLNSSDAEHRAAAAYMIGYAPKKSQVVNDLQTAMQDPDPGVRSNAMRALAAIGVYGARNPEAGIRISPTWFIEMLNSIVLSDRRYATLALGTLTEDRAESILSQIRERALDAVVEMARWKTLEYALPAFILAGRVGQTPEQEIHEAWKQGAREAVIEKAIASAKKRKSP